ncbi:MAG: nucleotidyltransferase family protein [Thermodesulfobacteriota bacterium]
MTAKHLLVSLDAPIREALKVINDSGTLIALVADEDQRLVGTVTDGDVRRGLLRGLAMDDPVSAVMFRDFTSVRESDDPATFQEIMRRKCIAHLPELDAGGRVVRLHLLGEEQGRRENWVVLMAGGLGTRLRPLTDDCPKPLLKVGGKPILQTIIEKFREAGFYRFFLSVNYRAEMVRAFFGDGSHLGVQIEYLHETEKLGTAGSLGLLPQRPDRPFFVMNGDLLTKVDFVQLLDFHSAQGATGTMCVREYQIQIPFGVVSVDGSTIRGVEEKPTRTFFVNAGIYAFSPEALDFVSQGDFLDMPTLFERLAGSGRVTSAFPIFEYWLDIGQMKDYEQGKNDYCALFEGSSATERTPR